MPFGLTSLVGTRLPRRAARLFPDLLWRMPARQRTAYLTFDDGPTPRLTGRLLDLLDRYDARATFFLVGAHAGRHPDLVRAIHEAGHALGNHTFTHPDAWAVPTSRVLSELDRTTGLLEELVQQPVRSMRPPYGRFTGAMRAWCLARRQQLTMWDVMPGDFLSHATSARIEQRLLHFTRPGSIVVLHDNPKCEACMPVALERVLRVLKDEGWRFPVLPGAARQ